MAKSKAKNKTRTRVAPSEVRMATLNSLTLAELRNNGEIWYKIRALLYDIQNLEKDKSCETRTLQTTDPLYISAPYFSVEEAIVVKGTIVDTSTGTTLEQALSSGLETFFEKRRASGDCRPCGPHDMVPVYLSCLGMDKSEIAAEKFLSRLRRAWSGNQYYSG